MTKDLELQITSLFYQPKSYNDPFHFIRTYLTHFNTNLSDFCGFECIKCRTTNFVLRPKDNRTMIKELELQITNWFYQPKSNNDPLHFKSKLNNFYGFGCIRCRNTNFFEAQKQQNDHQIFITLYFLLYIHYIPNSNYNAIIIFIPYCLSQF